MNIVRVYPLASLPRGLGHSFTYFTAQALPRGALVEVEIGRRKVPAIVVSMEELKKTKETIKRAAWRMKRVSKVLSPFPIFSEQFFSLAEWASDYFLIPPGLFLKQFFPAALFKSPTPPFNPAATGLNGGVPRQARIRTAIGTREDRTHLWANEAREALARNQSIFIITPTNAAAAHIASLFTHLPRAPFVLTGNLSVSHLRACWETIRDEQNGLVVIGTPIAIGAIRPDTTTVIMDDASSLHFRQKKSPYIPFERTLEKLSAFCNFSLWKGKRIASLADGLAPAGVTYVSPRRKTAPPSFIDLRKDEGLSSAFHRKRAFSLLSSESIAAIKNAADKRVIVFVNHRGYGTMMLCKDCGTPIGCPSCAIPLRLHKRRNDPSTQSPEEHMLICHHCGFRKPVSNRCPQCGSWNIEVYGIGIERVEEALREQFPHRPLLRLDADTQKNKGSRDALRNRFLAESEAILLATEMVLEDSLLIAPLLIVPSLDFLFTFPELDFAPRFLRMLWELADHAEESIIIQTFFPDHILFKAFRRGDPEGILREELKRRQETGWPPFSLLIKITAFSSSSEESRNAIERLAQEIKKFPRDPSEPMALQSYPAFIPKEKNLWRHHLLLRVDQAHWSDGYKKLKTILLSLDSSFTIIVDPLSTL